MKHRNRKHHHHHSPSPCCCHPGFILWFTGLSGAGKTTLNLAVAKILKARGYSVESLDGDVIRAFLSKDLGFEKQDRLENIRRIGYIAGSLAKHGVIVLVSAISPYRASREEIRQFGNVIEVFVNAPLEVCEQRDIKGLYRKARAGEMARMTGINDPYEYPQFPEVECRTDRESIEESVEKIMTYLEPRLPQGVD